jgi:hypothetical protein
VPFRIFLPRGTFPSLVFSALLSLFVRGDEPAPYTRIIEDSPRHFRIEVAWRHFQATGKPDVWLSGMVHDGSPDFFVKVEELLKTQPLVLLENDNSDIPEPPGPSATVDEKKAWTKKALQFLGELVEGYHHEFKVFPDSFDSVLYALDPASEWAFDMRACMTDGWGHPIAYQKTNDGYSVHSAGDGSGNDPALTVVHTANWSWTTINEDRVKDTDSLGLLDQSNGGLTFDHPNFYFCDMLVSEYNRRVQAASRDRSTPYFIAQDAPNAFDEKKYPHDMQVRRFRILEASGVPHIHEVMDPAGEDHVTLIERNDVVWAEVSRRIAESQPVCILYGAAHLYDLEQRLVRQEGYSPIGTQWMTVFEADLSNSKITDAEIAAIKDDAKSGRMGYY